MKETDKIVILFVDDERSVLNVLRRILIRVPYATRFVESGDAALALLANEAVDIIVADLAMPNMDGISLLAKVRDRYPDIVRIVLSASVVPDHILEAINKGEIYRFVSKPIEDMRKFIETMNQAAEQVRLHRQAREAERLKLDFLASITHELKSPLASIKGFAGTLLREPDMDAATRTEFLGHVVAECERLTLLVTSVLDMTRIDEGNFTLPMELTDLGLLLEETAESMRHYFESQGVTLRIRITTENACLPANWDRLIQVFRNVLDNALKYTPTGGDVEVALYEEAGALVARVVDSGCGIDTQDLPHVCERFFRGRREGVRADGVGLGLTIVKEILDRHGWMLTIESEKGNGTAVSIKATVAPHGVL